MIANRVVVTENPGAAFEPPDAVVCPSAMLALLHRGVEIRYDELYIDIDTVPDRLTAALLQCGLEDLYVYSGRYEQCKGGAGDDGGRQPFQGIVWRRNAAGRESLAFIDAEGNVRLRGKIYGAISRMPQRFGCKGLRCVPLGQQKLPKRFARRPFWRRPAGNV